MVKLLGKEQVKQREELSHKILWRRACVSRGGHKGHRAWREGAVGKWEGGRQGWVLHDFEGPDKKEFGFYPKCSGKPLRVFKTSGINCLTI